MNEQISAWSRSGDGLPSHSQATAWEVPLSLRNPEAQGLQDHPRSQSGLHAWCLCRVIDLPSHTPNHPRWSALAGTGFTSKQAALAEGCLLAPPGKPCVGKPILAKPSTAPCQVESHLLPQAHDQFKLPQMGLLRTILGYEIF